MQARWLIVRDGKGKEAVTVFYDNLVTGVRYTLGKLDSCVPDQMVVEWVITHGQAAYGDKIVLSDKTQFVFMAPETGACA